MQRMMTKFTSSLINCFSKLQTKLYFKPRGIRSVTESKACVLQAAKHHTLVNVLISKGNAFTLLSACCHLSGLACSMSELPLLPRWPFWRILQMDHSVLRKPLKPKGSIYRAWLLRSWWYSACIRPLAHKSNKFAVKRANVLAQGLVLTCLAVVTPPPVVLSLSTEPAREWLVSGL